MRHRNMVITQRLFFFLQVKVDLPVTNMDASGKTLAERAVANIKERGHTNLSGGLIAALQVQIMLRRVNNIWNFQTLKIFFNFSNQITIVYFNQALYAIPAEQASLVESVVLFSDGKANYGITDSNGLAKATK